MIASRNTTSAPGHDSHTLPSTPAAPPQVLHPALLAGVKPARFFARKDRRFHRPPFCRSCKMIAQKNRLLIRACRLICVVAGFAPFHDGRASRSLGNTQGISSRGFRADIHYRLPSSACNVQLFRVLPDECNIVALSLPDGIQALIARYAICFLFQYHRRTTCFSISS